jgi:hypothetical protein
MGRWKRDLPSEKQVAKMIERFRAHRSHDFDDITEFCLDCGISADAAIRGAVRCHGGPNVVAISHIVRGNRLDSTVSGPVYDIFAELGVDPPDAA